MKQAAIRSQFWAGRRVLITGHTGFKGCWLALWLSELGARVSGIGLPVDSSPHLFDQLGLQRRLQAHHIADIRDPRVLQELVNSCQPEVVLHLAAQPLVRRSYHDPLGTWATNVMGSLHLLEALRSLRHPCAVVMITTDKVYENREWLHGYREEDRLGGHDPYSASKAAAELAIASFRSSFCGLASHQSPHLAIATARAGNVIGGGDWAEDRIVPDAIRALAAGEAIQVRNPAATRPWQHVLEALSGYITLAEQLAEQDANGRDGADSFHHNPYTNAFNFGPHLEANRDVRSLIEEVLRHWPGTCVWQEPRAAAPHEAGQLHLQIDKAFHLLGWTPRWSFATTVERTINWYRTVDADPNRAESECLADIEAYTDRSEA